MVTEAQLRMRELQAVWTLKAKQLEQYHWTEQALIMLYLGQMDLAQEMNARCDQLTQELQDVLQARQTERS